VSVKDWVIRQAVRSAIGGENVDKLKTFFNRYIVLASVIYAALNFGLDLAVQHGLGWAPMAKTAISTVFGVLSFTPDPAASTAAAGAIAAGIALYGAGLKLYLLAKKPKA
jgi:hypothetical protein